MEQLWECTSGGDNDFSTLMCGDKNDLWNGLFDTDGKPKNWDAVPITPLVLPVIDKKRKKQLPMPDIRWLVPGAIILNEKSFTLLKDFLSRFGQLLPLDCAGEVNYFYNVTHLVACIDVEKSGKRGTAIVKAEFLQDAIPKDAQLFKDPLTAGSRIYLTQAAKNILERIIAENELTGLRFFEAGKQF